jgi:excisionase family DNA binding protein
VTILYLLDGQDILTVEQVADYLQVHPETVRRWIREGRLRGMNPSGKSGWRIRRDELQRFIRDAEERRDAAP